MAALLHQHLDFEINNLVMGQVIHPRVPDTPPDDVPIDKKQKDCTQRTINLNSSPHMYSPNYSHSQGRRNRGAGGAPHFFRFVN